MPELPEVEIYRRYLEKTSLNQPIHHIEIRDAKILRVPNPEVFAKSLVRIQFKKVSRRGKYLFIHLSSGEILLFHFGMTGNLRYDSITKLQELDAKITRFDRIRFHFQSNRVLSFISQRKFARIELWDSINDFINKRKIGPDALNITFPQFSRAIQSSKRPIKAILLDQHRIAGIGNLYADEALFQSKINPLILGSQISEAQIKKLHEVIQNILQIAIDHNAQYGEFPSNFFLHARVINGKCPICGKELEKRIVGQRTTIFCACCQPFLSS
ncbi:Fpg/Nei family DNA glycosylase [Candidatus Harpocratesius sp.]